MVFNSSCSNGYASKTGRDSRIWLPRLSYLLAEHPIKVLAPGEAHTLNDPA